MTDLISQHSELLELITFLLFISLALGVLIGTVATAFRFSYKFGPWIVIGAGIMWYLSTYHI